MLNKLTLAVCVAVLPLSAGCGPDSGKTIQLEYSRPAAFQVSAKVHSIAIAEFATSGNTGHSWGDVAADKLTANLDQQNKKYERYSLVDRGHLKQIMDQKDVNLMVSDPSSAVKVGKMAKVDAIVYGSVSATCRDQHRTRTTFDPLSQSSRQVPYTQRYCQVRVTFTMDDINTGMTLVSMSPTREYDTDKQKSSGMASVTKMLGVGKDELPPAEQVMDALIQQCVDEFVARVSPHDVSVNVTLGKGKSELVSKGNSLAAAGDYTEALNYYERAGKEKPDDADAFFNAGVMYEKTGQFKEAERMYSRAFEIKAEDRFVEARRRVRSETSEAPGATTSEKAVAKPAEPADQP